MAINVIIFGQIADITGAGNIEVESAADTNELLNHLLQRYPAIEQARYAIAVDKKIIRENTLLSPKSQVALLPPFSGG